MGSMLSCMMTDEFRDCVIRMAWEDRTTFEEIKEKLGLTEAEVIKVMRGNLKARSFRLWRKRVTGRKTKHRKIFKADRRVMRGNVTLEREL